MEHLTVALGLSQTAVFETAIGRLAKEETGEDETRLTPRQLMKLPREQRRAALAASAKIMTPIYNEDLAKPVAERDLTAFTALDGEPVLEDYIPEDFGLDQS
jgi:hypothetical protein